MRIANLFKVEAPSSGEHFEALAHYGATTIERIVSSDEPSTELYDQEQDEWVVLLRGDAELEIDGKAHKLSAGDFVSLPAHTPHRVISTTAGALWLAVHVKKS